MARGEVVPAGQDAPGQTTRLNRGPGVLEDPVVGQARVSTASGRISEASDVLAEDSRTPFSSSQLSRLDEALTLASRETGLLFTLYVGALGTRSRERAEELHASLADHAAEAVVVAVSPGERVVEVVTGAESGRRIDDRGAKLAVMSMVASFKESDLVGGMVEGITMLADQAGHAHH
ncbi:DUF5130 family protein [Actinomycetospora straminea]|uniref:DUF5130 family protein n=1 Tax=Actinomycetospora straminea TaxID=663607 RepID=A0ABP9FBE8_9PSEU|nr:DUF5130 family protein [Actinomycetospora straminea]MDD7935418.1 DUF5130 family protein [Actinomycetospora straminea]